MKVRKNVEAVFLVLAVCTTWAAYATAETPVVHKVAARSAAVVNSEVPVVVVTAKRLTAAEKAALD